MKEHLSLELEHAALYAVPADKARQPFAGFNLGESGLEFLGRLRARCLSLFSFFHG